MPANPAGLMPASEPLPQAIAAFVINLDRSAARWAFMEEQARACGITLERIAAIDAREITPETRRRHLLRPGRRGWLSDPELACSLSHRKAWAEAIARRLPFVAIFEDDVAFSPATAEFLSHREWIPPRTAAVKLEKFRDHALLGAPAHPAPNRRQLLPLVGSHLGAAGYIISQAAAAQLLHETETFSHCLDHALFNPETEGRLKGKIWQLEPALCIQQQASATAFLPRAAEHSSLEAARSLAREADAHTLLPSSGWALRFRLRRESTRLRRVLRALVLLLTLRPHRIPCRRLVTFR